MTVSKLKRSHSSPKCNKAIYQEQGYRLKLHLSRCYVSGQSSKNNWTKLKRAECSFPFVTLREYKCTLKGQFCYILYTLKARCDSGKLGTNVQIILQWIFEVILKSLSVVQGLVGQRSTLLSGLRSRLLLV